MPLIAASAVTFFVISAIFGLINTTTSANIDSLKQVGFSPRNFKKLSCGKESKKFYSKQILFITLLGNGFGVQEYRKEVADGTDVPGYAYPVYRVTRDGKLDVNDILSEKRLDARMSNFTFK